MASRADAERARKFDEEMEKAYAAVGAAVSETAARPRPVFDLPFARKERAGGDGELSMPKKSLGEDETSLGKSKKSLGKSKKSLGETEKRLENGRKSLGDEETSFGVGKTSFEGDDSSFVALRLDGLVLDIARFRVAMKSMGWDSPRKRNVRRVAVFLYRRGIRENSMAFRLHLKRSLVEDAGVSPATATRLIAEVAAAREHFFERFLAVPGQGTTVVLKRDFFIPEEKLLASMSLLDTDDKAWALAAMSGGDQQAAEAAVSSVRRALASCAEESNALAALAATLRGVSPEHMSAALRCGLSEQAFPEDAEACRELFGGAADIESVARRFGTDAAVLRERLYGIFLGDPPPGRRDSSSTA